MQQKCSIELQKLPEQQKTLPEQRKNQVAKKSTGPRQTSAFPKLSPSDRATTSTSPVGIKSSLRSKTPSPTVVSTKPSPTVVSTKPSPTHHQQLGQKDPKIKETLKKGHMNPRKKKLSARRQKRRSQWMSQRRWMFKRIVSF